MSRSNVTTSLEVERMQWTRANQAERVPARPQTARAHLGGAHRGTSSPYNAPPSDPHVFGLRTKSPNPSPHPPHDILSDRNHGGRAVYVRVPRPPGKEYRPLRARSSYGRTGHDPSGIAGDAEFRQELAKDAVVSMKKPPLSARGRMQNFDVGGTSSGVIYKDTPMFAEARDDAFTAGEGSEQVNEERSVDEKRGAVILPSTGSAFAPPQPLRQEPNPRRRMATMTSSDQQLGHSGQGTVKGDMPKKTALLKELGPAMSAIASLTHETSIGKLARSIDAVTLVLLEADACRICLYDSRHKLLQVLRPGDSLEGSNRSNQIQARGVTGLVAGSGSLENAAVLHEHSAFDHDSDVGAAANGRIPKMSYLCVPAQDKGNEVVAVISAIRMGSQAIPFSEEDEAMAMLIAKQVGVALSHALQRHDMVRARWQQKVLVKAAIELTGNLELEHGPLCCLAGTFAKKLTEADTGTVCLTYDQNRMMRNFDLVEPSASSPTHLDRKHDGRQSVQSATRAGAASPTRGAPHMQEYKELQVPAALKKVVTTSSVCNILVHRDAPPDQAGPDLLGDDLPAGWPSDGKVVTSVFAGEAAGNEIEVDSCLAVPLQTHSGARVFGFIQVLNRCGGPRKVGRHGVFNKTDEEMLRELGYIVASALQRIERIEGLEGAVRCASEMTALQQEQAAVELLKTQVAETTRADKAFVFLLDPDGNWELFHKPEEKKPLRRGRHHKKEEGVRLPANAYPLGTAATGWTAHHVRLRDVNERILAPKGALMTHATVMMACAIRDIEGTVYGVLLLANQHEDHFPRHGKRVVKDMCVQAGTVLKNCLLFKQHEENAKNLQHSSLEMLDIVKKREMEQIMNHVATTISSFMCCSRAVLYMVDVGNRSIWTIGPDENLIVTDIKEDADPTVEGSRAGFANIALKKKEAIVVKDFAYGQHAFNDLLDSADVKHVEKLIKLQSMAGAADPNALFKLKSELEPEERTESTAVIPIWNSTREVVGVLQVMNRWKSNRSHRLRKEGFDIYDMDKLALIGEAVAFSLENAAIINRRWEAESNLRGIVDAVTNGLSVGLGTASRLDVDDAMSYAAKRTATMCGATQASLFLLDSNGQMDIIRFEGNLFRPAKRIKSRISGIAGAVVSRGQTMNIEDVREHPSFDALVDQKQHLPVVSMLCCPVRNPSGRILGCLAMQNKRVEHTTVGENTDPFTSHGTHASRKAGAMRGTDHAWAPFTQCDEKTAEAASQGIGMALTQNQLFHHASSVSDRLKDISVDLDQEATLSRVATACEKLCHAQRCLVFLLDDKTFQMVYHGREGRDEEIRIVADYGLPGAVRRSGGTEFFSSREEIFRAMSGRDGSESALNKQRYDEMIMQVTTAIAVPITNDEGRVVGVLELANKLGGGTFEKADELVLKVLASHAFTMIKHCRTLEMQSSKRSGLEDILLHVVGLVQEVARSYPQHLTEATTYKDIVRATCLMLGAYKGHLYVLLPGDHRHWIAYDDEGNAVKERTSRVAMSVLETGTLHNNTNTPMHPERIVEESKGDDDEEGEQNAEEEEEAEEPEDSKMMCAPILMPNHMGIKGHTLLGALEVEAMTFNHEWTSEHEEILRIMAGVAASLLDIMRQIRQSTTASNQTRKGSTAYSGEAGISASSGYLSPTASSRNHSSLVSSLVSTAPNL